MDKNAHGKHRRTPSEMLRERYMIRADRNMRMLSITSGSNKSIAFTVSLSRALKDECCLLPLTSIFHSA